MKTFTNSIEIAAPAEKVWELTLDVERWPSLFPTVTGVARVDEGPMRVGSSARIKQPGQPERVWTVTECEAPRRFVWGTKAKGFTMRAIHSISPAGTRTANTLEIEIDGPLAGVVAAVAGRKLRKVLATENEGFRTAAQNGQPLRS